MSAPSRLWRLLPLLLLLPSCGTSMAVLETADAPPDAAATPTLKQAHKYGLQEVREVIPDISVDLRYKTARNVAGRPVYPRDMPCLLRTSTLKRLQAAQDTLRNQGYRIRIWDAWRPPEAHHVLYAHGGKTGMFQDPRHGWSRHCGGVAIDATLVDAQGNEVPMPTYFDEDLEKADIRAPQADPAILKNMRTLHHAMRQAGLIPLANEWWHFDDRDFLYSPIPVVKGSDLGVRVR